MMLHEDLARVHHQMRLRDSQLSSRAVRVIAARRAQRRAERAACRAREAALQAALSAANVE
ncbi:MAG TPA: hypothetical protein VMT88_08935 [Actinomycetes bacterium]|nr:hypothetical protein [Actinomycetes bacterium]